MSAAEHRVPAPFPDRGLHFRMLPVDLFLFVSSSVYVSSFKIVCFWFSWFKDTDEEGHSWIDRSAHGERGP